MSSKNMHPIEDPPKITKPGVKSSSWLAAAVDYPKNLPEESHNGTFPRYAEHFDARLHAVYFFYIQQSCKFDHEKNRFIWTTDGMIWLRSLISIAGRALAGLLNAAAGHLIVFVSTHTHTFIGRIHSRYEITIHQPGAWHCPSHSKRGCKSDRTTIAMAAICWSVFARHIFVWQMTRDRSYLVQKSIFSNCFDLF